MNFKVYKGTQPDRHLCSSCCAAITRVEGGKGVTVCREMPGTHAHIRGKVTECSLYHDKEAHRLMGDMQSQAWHLDMDEDGQLAWRTPADRENQVRYRRSSRRRRNPGTGLVPTDGGSEPGPVIQ